MLCWKYYVLFLEALCLVLEALCAVLEVLCVVWEVLCVELEAMCAMLEVLCAVLEMLGNVHAFQCYAGGTERCFSGPPCTAAMIIPPCLVTPASGLSVHA